MFKKSFWTGLIFFSSVLFLSAILWNFMIPKEDSKLTKEDFLSKTVSKLNYVAIGDSLTEGVGDTTNQGGFVPLLADSLSSAYGYQVATSNYGVSGNTSQQILKRMTEKKAIQDDLKKANLMTLTVGGNDVMAVIRKNLTTLKVSSFTQPAKAYQKRLRQIIEVARSENPNLPIYILGIYNPFYLNFPEMTEMQEVIDNWNNQTEAVTAEYEGVYFVPINELLYKGLDGEEGIVESSGQQTQIINDVLFTGDHFHPNNTGYRIMSTAVMEKISETKSTWSKD
ncbi:SGNH/GDSL hydrolase family protein [Streptococcus sp. SGI.013]|uniref:SGNH/GDSL hydrolase family protein n=1 Tax=unclassified Streptococcus TaxID=2608887 RepID=UPI003D092F45